jgi:hypothetical protein
MLWIDLRGKFIAYQLHQHREKTEFPNLPLTQGGRFKTILHVCMEVDAQASHYNLLYIFLSKLAHFTWLQNITRYLFLHFYGFYTFSVCFIQQI